MHRDAKEMIQYLHRKLGKDELRAFLSLFGTLRITIPAWQNCRDAARDAEVIEAFRTKSPGTITEFYRQQAREHGCSSRTIERILVRQLKKSA